MKKILLVVLSLFLIFALVGCTDDSVNESQGNGSDLQETQEQDKKAIEEEITVISAPELSKAFEDDEAKADELYKGETLAIEGQVMTRGKIGERTFVILEVIEGSAEKGVQCFFEDQAEVAKVEDLREKDPVIIQGEVEGNGRMNVKVIDCVLK